MVKKQVALCLSVLVIVTMACNLPGLPNAVKGAKDPTATPAADSANPASTPTWTPSLTKLKSQQFQPSSDSQTLQSDQGLSVTLPGGVLDKAQEVAISQVKGNIPDGFSGFKPLATFDVTVGDQQTFNKPLAIDYTFDPSALDATRPAKDQIFAQVWDTASQTWTLLDVSVDETRHVARVETDHLCPVSFNMLLSGQVWTETPHFFIYYWPSEVTQLAGPYKRHSTDPCTHPDYVCDVGDVLEKVHASYTDKNYVLPDKKIYVFIKDIDDSSTTPFSKAIRVPIINWRDYEVLRSGLAHELFHVYQLNTLGVMTVSARKWWMEATADYAGDRVAYEPERTNQMGVDIKPKYLASALDSTADFHDYSTSHFIDYLINIENVSTFDYLWSNSAQHKDDNMLLFLDQFLQKRSGTGLAEHYESFGLYYLFDASSPIRKLHTSIDAIATQQVTYTETPGGMVISWDSPAMSAKLLRLDSDAPRFLTIGMWNPQANDHTLIYKFPDDPLGEDSAPTPLADLTPDAKPVSIHVEKDEALYILVFNLSVVRQANEGVVVGSSETEVYTLTLHFDDGASDCAQQAASGLGYVFVYLDRKKGTVTVAYHSQEDDPYWSEGAEHTVTVDGSGKLVGEEITGSFSGTDSLDNGDGGSMNIEATFDFTASPDDPNLWDGVVKGEVVVKIPTRDTSKGMDCTAAFGTKRTNLWPSSKVP